jgi:ketosteroid isomerase-like protein
MKRAVNRCRTILVLCLSLFLMHTARAAEPGDVMAPIRQFLDGFNTGDVKSAFAAFASGDISIVDEFAPHHWTGPDAPHAWAADYEKHAKATGVTDGIVKYSAANRYEVNGAVAYVIVPGVYEYKEHGKPIAEEGQLTFVLNYQNGGWKIRAFTWTGKKPHPRI